MIMKLMITIKKPELNVRWPPFSLPTISYFNFLSWADRYWNYQLHASLESPWLLRFQGSYRVCRGRQEEGPVKSVPQIMITYLMFIFMLYWLCCCGVQSHLLHTHTSCMERGEGLLETHSPFSELRTEQNPIFCFMPGRLPGDASVVGHRIHFEKPWRIQTKQIWFLASLESTVLQLTHT